MTDEQLLAVNTDEAPTVLVKGGDYEYKGQLVSVFTKLGPKKQVRCVVEDSCKRLFIHNAKQVELA